MVIKGYILILLVLLISCTPRPLNKTKEGKRKTDYYNKKIYNNQYKGKAFQKLIERREEKARRRYVRKLKTGGAETN